MSNDFNEALQEMIENQLDSDVAGVFRATGQVTQRMLPESLSVELYEQVHDFDRSMLAATVHSAGELAAGCFSDPEFDEDRVSLEVEGINGSYYAASVMRDGDNISVSSGLHMDMGSEIGDLMDNISELALGAGPDE